MVRLLLWMLIIYVGWKIYRSFVRQSPPSSRSTNAKSTPGSFDNVEDAEFEDVTPKPPDKPA